MARVGRGAVLANRRARAIGAVEPVVAVGAQAAELTQPERGEIARAALVAKLRPIIESFDRLHV
jgi:hypothetical protein